MSVNFLHEGRVFRLLFQGTVSQADAVQALRAMRSDPEFSYARVFLHDLMETDGPLTSVVGMDQAMERELNSFFIGPRLKHAVVAKDAAQVTAYAMALENAGIDFEVFDSRNDAAVWADATTGFADFLDSQMSDGAG